MILPKTNPRTNKIVAVVVTAISGLTLIFANIFYAEDISYLKEIKKVGCHIPLLNCPYPDFVKAESYLAIGGILLCIGIIFLYSKIFVPRITSGTENH